MVTVACHECGDDVHIKQDIYDRCVAYAKAQEQRPSFICTGCFDTGRYTYNGASLGHNQ